MKIKKLLLSLLTLASSSVFAAASTPSVAVDITPVFKEMEKNCGSDNEQFRSAMGWFITNNGKPPSNNSAPPALKSTIGKGHINIKDDGDGWTLSAHLTNAKYRGATVTQINRWIGKDNGINGVSLNFADSLPVIVKLLGKIKADKNSEVTQPFLGIDEKTKKAILVCDFSN